MAEYLTNTADLTKVADSIRAKGGTSAPLAFPDGFATAVSKITTGVDTSDATATAAEVFSGKTAYLSSGKQTGTFTIAPELTAQQTKLDAIKAALKDKGSGGGGGVAPFKRIVVKTWTPDSDTNTYTVTDDPANVVMLEIYFMSASSTASGIMRASVMRKGGPSSMIQSPNYQTAYQGTAGRPPSSRDAAFVNGNDGTGYDPETGKLLIDGSKFITNFTYAVVIGYGPLV